MIKKISTVALATLLCLPALAHAGAGSSSDRVADLEKQMAEMNKAFNAQMQAMKEEIAALKSKNAEMGKEVASTSETVKNGRDAAEWTKKVAFGGQVAMSGYSVRDVWNLDSSNDVDDRDLLRTRGSLWATIKASDDLSGFIKITNQSWGEGTTYYSGIPDQYEADNNSNKLFLDNAYISLGNLFSQPLTATIGRQNLIYGSGFVLMDGQSQFQSASIYFDGVKLSWQQAKTITLDAFYMKDQENNPANVDNATGKGDDINVGGFYLTNSKCALTGMQQELYALNRYDEGINKDIWMYGARLSDKLANGIDYSLEGAIQTGKANATQDQDAYGLKFDAGYTFKQLDCQPRLYAGYSYLSGDDGDGNGDFERWDVFYGGWPQWGDLLAWKFAFIPGLNSSMAGVDPAWGANVSTVGEAAFGNLETWTIGASARLSEKLSANLSYASLSFNETLPGVADDFGDYYQATFLYQHNKYLRFTLYGALLNPGEAFKTIPAQDKATEAMWEAEFKF